MSTALEIGRIREEIKALEKDSITLPMAIKQSRGIDDKLAELRKTEKLLLLQWQEEKEGGANSNAGQNELLAEQEGLKKTLLIGRGIVGALALTLVVIVVVRKIRKK